MNTQTQSHVDSLRGTSPFGIPSALGQMQQCETAREPQIAKAFAVLEKTIARQTELVNQLLVRIEPIRLQSLNKAENCKEPCPAPKPHTAPIAGKLNDFVQDLEILNGAISIAISQIEL